MNNHNDYIAVYHSPGCGGKMFWVKSDAAKDHALVKASEVMLLDESFPKDGDPIICGSCGFHLNQSPLPSSFHRIVV